MNEIEQLHAEIADLKRQLQSSNDQSKRYLQNVAHQLTAPLGAIKWSIEALKDEEIPIHRKGNLLRSVYSQATILVHLVKNFSLMSNLDADEQLGQMRNQEGVDLMLLAINLSNDFQPQAFDVEKKIVVDNDSFKNVLGSKKIHVEKNLVAQALSNLLENAVKYAFGSTTIKLHAVKTVDGVAVAVTSEGIPISEGDKQKLFDRGVRGVQAKALVPAGTGIGLYLAKRVMQLHNGRIELQTRENISKFLLCFPATRIL